MLFNAKYTMADIEGDFHIFRLDQIEHETKIILFCILTMNVLRKYNYYIFKRKITYNTLL